MLCFNIMHVCWSSTLQMLYFALKQENFLSK